MCGDGSGHGRRRSCCPLGGQVRGFVQPWLLLLCQGPSHGYELMERLAQDDEIPGVDPGLLYRTLRQMEEAGLLRSAWETEGRGPARRVYEISEEGLDHLRAWAVTMRQTRRRLDRLLREYASRLQEGGAP